MKNITNHDSIEKKNRCMRSSDDDSTMEREKDG